MATKQRNLHLQLNPQAKRVLEQFCAHQGMTQKTGMARLLEWFARQDPVVQAAIVGQLPEMFLDTAKDKVKFEMPKQEKVES